jgi:predicted RNA-binding protein
VAVASRSVPSSGLNFKGIVFTLLALALVVGLFFIPEIIQFQRTISGTTKVVGAMKTLQTATVKTPADPKDSQLSRIAALIDSGYLARISSGRTDDQKKTAEKPAEVSVATDKNKKEVSPESQKSIVTNDSGLNWKAIKSKESRPAIQKAQSQMMEILGMIPVDRRGSRFALLNFANGVTQILESSYEKTSTAPQAINLLEKLHSATVKEFLREGVGQVIYKRFVGIDFGSVLSSASPILSGQGIPFNPQLTLTKVALQQKKKGQVEQSLKVSFEGYVVGDDVVRIELVSAGIRLDDILPKKSDANGYRKFRIKSFELDGKVLLKVFDRHGRLFQKLYSIYPRARIFENQKGRFQIPDAVSEYDNRLDRFFTMEVSEPTEKSDLFLESQGFEKF